MPAIEINTFALLAKLLLAARKLATDPDPLNRAKALADLATNGKALNAALRDTGLSPLATEMEQRAKELDRYLTHEGRAKDDARNIFWQVAPVALEDPAHLTGAALDPDAATDAMVRAIHGSTAARDFAQTAYAEDYFRNVMSGTLAVMVTQTAFIDAITPDLWRRSLANQNIQIAQLDRIEETGQRTAENVDEIKALLLRHLESTGEAASARASGITDARIIALAQEVAADIDDAEQAFLELEAAIEDLKDYRQRSTIGANADSALIDLRTRLEALANEGKLHDAQSEANAALERWEAEWAERQARETQIGIAYLNEAIRRDLDVRDAKGAAEKIARRVALDTPDPAARFNALRAEQDVWYERGRDKGLRLDLEIAIALARIAHAPSADDRGAALNDLGLALWTLGEREQGTDRLVEAVACYRDALTEYTRDRVPLQWATVQMNLGNALWTLGDREQGTDRLMEAVACYRDALTERTRDRVPLQWATTQMNLGTALAALGEREQGTDRLEEAVACYRDALTGWTRDRVPLDWARAQLNLGTALWTLGQREQGTDRLEEAVACYRDALTEWTRDRVPLDWAMVQMNLGTALAALGQREQGTDRLMEAVACYRDALTEYTRDRVPMDWALTQMNLGNALKILGQREQGTDRLFEAVACYRDALTERTRDRVPLDWANTRGNEATALLQIAERRADADLARQALAQLTEAAQVLRDGGHIPWAETFEHQIPTAQALVTRLSAS